jgi:flagellar assembly protein FliH
LHKILKYNYVNFDEAKVNLEPPTFKYSVSLDDFENNIDNEEFITDESLQDGEGASENMQELDVELSSNDILDIAKIQADEIVSSAVEKAEREAKEICDEAHRQSEEEAKKLYEEAKEKGYREGYDKAMSEVCELKEEAQEAVRLAENERKEFFENVEGELVDLTVSVIEKILNDAKAVNPQIIMAVIRKGLSEAKMTGDIFIHVSDKEYDTVMERKDEIPELNDNNVNIEIIKDFSLESGDCYLETAFGNIDCGIDSQFKKVRESLYFILDNK